MRVVMRFVVLLLAAIILCYGVEAFAQTSPSKPTAAQAERQLRSEEAELEAMGADTNAALAPSAVSAGYIIPPPPVVAPSSEPTPAVRMPRPVVVRAINEAETVPASPAVARSTRTCGLGGNLQTLSVNDKTASIRVLSGAQFAPIQNSCLANKFDTDWEAVFTDPLNQYKDFIGACFMPGRRIKLDADRMGVKPWDESKLNGRVHTEFMKDCEANGGRLRFALQAGQIIVLSAKNSQNNQSAPSAKTENAAPASSAKVGKPPVQLAKVKPKSVAGAASTQRLSAPTWSVSTEIVSSITILPRAASIPMIVVSPSPISGGHPEKLQQISAIEYLWDHMNSLIALCTFGIVVMSFFWALTRKKRVPETPDEIVEPDPFPPHPPPGSSS